MSNAQRRTGDEVEIPGDYQYRAINEASGPQRFWHWAKYHTAEVLLKPEENNKIFDVGCGSGVFANQLAENYRADVTGVDGNIDAITFAQNQFQRDNLNFQNGLVDELGFEKESIDRITFLEVIEHIHYQQGIHVLEQFRDLLVPGGRLVLSTPNYRSAWPFIEWTLDTLKLVPQLAEDQHVAFYHCSKLRKTGESAGLKFEDYRTINMVAPWSTVLSWKLGKLLHGAETKFRQPLGSIIVMSFIKA
jgi:2-polyprenyl-3-methyl-5-hydroxy-6-metoxy-1,4-benzoquinol methylase